ncbi:DUF4229 domain-containing protein [Corynebacterium heidelbergense]|uniref:DUF4229 domain-containing protein n=1 Tax=Corynebacterium heidelbergense TaxID=2055947 RepID=A0A364V9C7_9CORY|nr:DUF4229 domain-containing protein [Corynebacterium heidelbergense]
MWPHCRTWGRLIIVRLGRESRVGVVTEKSDTPLAAEPASLPNTPKLSGKAWRDIALYGLLRLLLFIALTVVIHSIVILAGMANYFPLLISAMLALILALPLSMLLFRKLRLRVTEQMAQWDANRRAHKETIRQQLQERLDT